MREGERVQDMRDADNFAAQRAVEFRICEIRQLHVGRAGSVEHGVDDDVDPVVTKDVGQSLDGVRIGDIAGDHPDIGCTRGDEGSQSLGDGGRLPRPVHQGDSSCAVLHGVFAELQADVAGTTCDQHVAAGQR